MNILCLDPGITTGVAYIYTGEIPKTDALKTHEEVYLLVDSIHAHHGGWNHVVIEQFSTDNMISKYGLRTVELVGAVEVLCWLRGIPFHRRVPMQRKPFLLRAERYLKDKKGRVDHEVDALAHLIGFLNKLEREEKVANA